MQTDNTLILGLEEFSNLENSELTIANFSAKLKAMLADNAPLIFNGCIVTQKGNTVEIRQKEQGKKIQLINVKAEALKQDYIRQRARGAYIATIC